MAVHSMTVAQILSRVRQAIPEAKETYVMNLVNDAIVESGLWNTKISHLKMNSTDGQMWYDIDDSVADASSDSVNINKITNVSFMDANGDYVKIPRLLNAEIEAIDTDNLDVIDLES